MGCQTRQGVPQQEIKMNQILEKLNSLGCQRSVIDIRPGWVFLVEQFLNKLEQDSYLLKSFEAVDLEGFLSIRWCLQPECQLHSNDQKIARLALELEERAKETCSSCSNHGRLTIIDHQFRVFCKGCFRKAWNKSAQIGDAFWGVKQTKMGPEFELAADDSFGLMKLRTAENEDLLILLPECIAQGKETAEMVFDQNKWVVKLL